MKTRIMNRTQQEHLLCPLRKDWARQNDSLGTQRPSPPTGSQDVRDDSGKNVSIALEEPSDVVATTNRTLTGGPVTEEACTEKWVWECC